MNRPIPTSASIVFPYKMEDFRAAFWQVSAETSANAMNRLNTTRTPYIRGRGCLKLINKYYEKQIYILNKGSVCFVMTSVASPLEIHFFFKNTRKPFAGIRSEKLSPFGYALIRQLDYSSPFFRDQSPSPSAARRSDTGPIAGSEIRNRASAATTPRHCHGFCFRWFVECAFARGSLSLPSVKRAAYGRAG